MDRKERILAFINSKEYIPLKGNELMTVLDVPGEAHDEFYEILNELCSEGKIYQSKRGRFVSVNAEELCVAGKLVCNAKGYFGFIICDDEDEEDIFVQGDDMMNALNGDRVLVRIDNTDNKGIHHRQGHVIKVLERGNKTVVGVIYKEKDGYLCLRPDNRRIYTKICINPEYAMDAKTGDRTAVSITEYTEDGKVFGEVISVLGEEDSLKSCIEGIIISNNIKQEFDSETLIEAGKIPESVDNTKIQGREDLRDMLIFTIDGDDARDFDDAVSLTLTDNGNYSLGVHIADVSEYVGADSALDREAYERGTSVYLADRVIPMLPEALSNGICSLNPKVDRLTLSVFMEISADGNVLSHRLSKSVICSKERMTYNNVNKILEEDDSELCERYEYMLPTLRMMERLAEALRERRVKKGAIQFDFPESRVIVNEDGEPVDVVKEIRGVSNKMIEEFMLAANETVAEYAFWSEIPFIYRNHEAPSEEKIKSFNDFIRPYGLCVKGKIDSDNPVHPKALQQIVDAVKDTPEERIVSMTMLRSLMKAKYSEENLGHFGLAAKYYCHFTSPIRRYPDLAIHRILKGFLDGKLTVDKIRYLNGYTANAGRQSSDCEINAENTERDVDDLMKTAYMSGFIGESFNAVVANVTSFGMFVELENSIEGLIRLEHMTDDYYEFDEKAGTLTGKRTRKVYSSGDNVKVVLAKADILLGQIDFVLEHDVTENLLKSFEKVPEQRKSEKKIKKRYKPKKKIKFKHKRKKK
ncbi:MAG: ribonuclease R [Oscillospiraceae bacterium]|nr:ribonuclease R [Oscillospiraceae bacterium]